MHAMISNIEIGRSMDFWVGGFERGFKMFSGVRVVSRLGPRSRLGPGPEVEPKAEPEISYWLELSGASLKSSYRGIEKSTHNPAIFSTSFGFLNV